jgi:heme ABC exporter ATP-binding subunit CcmA
VSGPSGSFAGLEAVGLTRSFGDAPVFPPVSFRLVRGEGLSVTGPNGSGKTTLLRLLAGLLRPSAGRVALQGCRVGFAGVEGGLYPELSAREHLAFVVCLRDGRGHPDRVAAALTDAGLQDQADRPARELSAGFRQRLRLALAVVHHPAVLLLDEPHAHLDEAGRERLSVMLRGQLARGVAVAATADPAVLAAEVMASRGQWSVLDLGAAGSGLRL